MSVRPWKARMDVDSRGAVDVPRRAWGEFLATFNREHRAWCVRIETHDRVTDEDVTSQENTLESIDYDLEDEKNPRINVTVRIDNKIIKHILFRPSAVVLFASDDGRQKCLRVITLNTETSVHLSPPVTRPVREHDLS